MRDKVANLNIIDRGWSILPSGGLSRNGSASFELIGNLVSAPRIEVSLGTCFNCYDIVPWTPLGLDDGLDRTQLKEDETRSCNEREKCIFNASTTQCTRNGKLGPDSVIGLESCTMILVPDAVGVQDFDHKFPIRFNLDLSWIDLTVDSGTGESPLSVPAHYNIRIRTCSGESAQVSSLQSMLATSYALPRTLGTIRIQDPSGKRLASTRDWPAWRATEYPRIRATLKSKHPGFLWP